ncbi:MAG TPA: methylated-DNA--[protein]-cysteine S-methyltransferase [Acidobacteriaceae bacterium]|nr:methylated-DNA--[protein]-cysteine S-methyltransferase [Acidobacteriaceae bacterium]
MELPGRKVCYRALQSRDSRFDGLLFVGVTSTGTYCRPICPARTPRFENCNFFGSAAAAQDAGFRPCLRCRPETAPDLASWRGTSNTVSRALALIAEGALDGEENSVEKLADRLGLGERQLRRLFLQHLGAPPVSVAQTRRVLFAKQLIHETRMPMTEVAMAAGFGSLRRFNETFLDLFHRPPSELRGRVSPRPEEKEVTLRLRYRPPYHWDSMLGYLRARAIPGVEWVDGERYLRTVEIDGAMGSVEVTCQPGRESLQASIRFPDVRLLPAIVSRVRRLFDLGADIGTIEGHLSGDPALAPLVAQRPGLRAPGGWDGFEIAVRAVLGQQISVEAARRLAGRLVALHGRAAPRPFLIHPDLTHAFPTAKRLASACSIGLAMPAARLAALKAVAEAALDDPNLFHPLGSIEETIARLRTIRGIGDWTAQYIALRAIREMDAFPATDLGLLRGAALMDGKKTTPADLLSRAESWRPWRAYAAQHLWAAGGTAAQRRIPGGSPAGCVSRHSSRALPNRKGQLMSLVYKTIESPVRKLTLVASDRGLVAILWEKDAPGRVQLGEMVKEEGHPVLLEAERQLGEYFAGKRKSFSIALDMRGTRFQKEVWEALLAIPFGETRSYGQLARQLGNPRATRAVGAANGRNPLSIVVPCHRVIGSSGKLTGFAGGLDVKAHLLRLEQ